MADRTDVDFDVTVQANGDAVIRKRDELLRRRLCRRAQAVCRDGARGAAPVLPGGRRADFPGRDRRGRTGDGVRFVSRRRAIHRPRPALRRPRSGDYLYFTLPASLQDLFGFRSETRDNPIFWPGPRRIAIRTTLTLPPEFATLALQPAEVEWKAPQGAGVVRVLSYRRKAGGGSDRTGRGNGAALRDRADREPVAGHDSGDGLRRPAPHPAPAEPPERAHGPGDGGRRAIDQPAGGFLCFVAGNRRPISARKHDRNKAASLYRVIRSVGPCLVA